MSSVLFLFFVLPLSVIVGVLVGTVASIIASARVATFAGFFGWVCALVVLHGLMYG